MSCRNPRNKKGPSAHEQNAVLGGFEEGHGGRIDGHKMLDVGILTEHVVDVLNEAALLLLGDSVMRRNIDNVLCSA